MSNFHSKILLFGEYSIVAGGKGLAIPYTAFKGQLQKATVPVQKTSKRVQASQEGLRLLGDYIKSLSKPLFNFDKEAFSKDMRQGMFFDSDIPQGFGLGSSGALIAALYHRYVLNRTAINVDGISQESMDLLAKLKQHFAQIENYFHGQSSGVDPLICYLDAALLMKSKTALVTTSVPANNPSGKFTLFLYNTYLKRQTGPLVEWFVAELKKEAYSSLINKDLKPLNDACIDAFLLGDGPTLWQHIKVLSALQQECFVPMIPTQVQNAWMEGLRTGIYYLKICGAGGGGFMIGMTDNFLQTQKLLGAENLKVIIAT